MYLGNLFLGVDPVNLNRKQTVTKNNFTGNDPYQTAHQNGTNHQYVFLGNDPSAPKFSYLPRYAVDPTFQYGGWVPRFPTDLA